MEKCYICDSECEGFCRICGKPVCENCVAPYNQFTEIDFDLCINCFSIFEDEKRNEFND